MKSSFSDDATNDWSDAARPHGYGDSPVSQHSASGEANPSDAYDAPPSEQAPVSDPEIETLIGRDETSAPVKRVPSHPRTL